MHLRGQYSNPSGALKALLEAIFEIPEGPSAPTTEVRRSRLDLGGSGGHVRAACIPAAGYCAACLCGDE